MSEEEGNLSLPMQGMQVSWFDSGISKGMSPAINHVTQMVSPPDTHAIFTHMLL